jgi:alkaline phosphatase D
LSRFLRECRSMKSSIVRNFALLFLLVSVAACSQQEAAQEKAGTNISAEFAPPEAFSGGSTHPYFGSENPWDRRFFSSFTAVHLYGRRGQRQMLDIVEGRPEEAAAYCRELLEKDPADLESLFNLAVAESRMGSIPAAMVYVRKAVELGLPFERFLVGPRDMLLPLLESEEFRRYAAGRDPVQLLHGPLVGAVTEQSARFWVRTLDEVSVQVVLSRSPDLSEPLTSETGRSLPGRDFTAIVQAQGLRPATTYYYDVLLAGKPALTAPLPSFRTYLPAGTASQFQVAFGGCAGYNPPAERIWDLIRGYQTEALLLLGDNVYIDLPEMPNGLHYYTYYQRQSRPEFRRLVSSIPTYAIWDDHDAAIDDVWLGPYTDKPAWKMPLFRQFQENWNNPAWGAEPQWPGCWFNFSIGPVDVFMLECRLYRTNPFDKDPTMLGPVQKAWLKEKLKESKAVFKMIVSAVPWAFEAKPEVKDTWNGFQEERREIFDFLAENRIDGVILLSGDRHRSDAWLIDRPNGYPLYEFESCRLTNQHVHALEPGALFGYNEKQSFGLLSFDTTIADPAVTYQIISIDDEVVGEKTVRLSEISH